MSKTQGYTAPVTEEPVTIYTGDGALAGDRIVDLDEHILQVQHGGNVFLKIDPTTDFEESALQAYNATDDGNLARVELSASPTESQSEVIANFNNGVKQAKIEAFADATEATIESTADTHTFNGNVEIDSDSGDVSFGAYQQNISSGQSEAGLKLSNTGTGGLEYGIVSTSVASGLGGSMFGLLDVSNTRTFFQYDGAGRVMELTAANGFTFNGAVQIVDGTEQNDYVFTSDAAGIGSWQPVPTPTVTEANISLSDVTTDDVSTTKHGFAPKGDGTTTKFLNANGAYSTPAGGTFDYTQVLFAQVFS